MNLLKSLFVTVFVFAANLTVFANSPETELIYNTEEIDGVKMSETVYKMNEGILTNFENITISTTTRNKLLKTYCKSGTQVRENGVTTCVSNINTMKGALLSNTINGMNQRKIIFLFRR